jgi:glucose-1-phosphate cytidylyltransferase
MKVVILAGGLGSRLGEETSSRPKPMVEIGGMPILWHIMKIYSSFGMNDFIVCLGYKGYMIKEYFSNYRLHLSDVTVDLARDVIEVHRNYSEPWRVTLVDTGPDSMTGGRLKAVAPYLEGEDAFCLTYGDGVGDVDIGALIDFHRAQGRLATVTTVTPPGRYGALEIVEGRVTDFHEKPDGDGRQINGGFFVASPRVLDYIDGPQTTWEREPLERLAREGQLSAFTHDGFWHAMDTLRDKLTLEDLWQSGRAPWKTW